MKKMNIYQSLRYVFLKEMLNWFLTYNYFCVWFREIDWNAVDIQLKWIYLNEWKRIIITFDRHFELSPYTTLSLTSSTICRQCWAINSKLHKLIAIKTESSKYMVSGKVTKNILMAKWYKLNVNTKNSFAKPICNDHWFRCFTFSAAVQIWL